jgi:hypothetical protein
MKNEIEDSRSQNTGVDDVDSRHEYGTNWFRPGRKKIRPKRSIELYENQRGRYSERLFEDFVEEIIRQRTIPELLRIRKASKRQNIRKRTDFRLTFTIGTLEITAFVNVKSSFGGISWFHRRPSDNKSKRVYPIAVNHNTTLSQVLSEIRKILRMELENLNRETNGQNS